jgi:Enoyl-CoA hydratase/isomerase
MAAEVASSGGLTRITRVGGIAWLALDDSAKKVNTLSTRLFAEFEARIAELENNPPDALVIVSGKPDGFVAGADLEELAGLSERGPILAMLQRGHELMERLADLPFPTVAAIHGACLGGGLELALACGRRVATQHPKTKLGLPEVQLGLIPGLGGTQRLPRLIGVPDALDLILTRPSASVWWTKSAIPPISARPPNGSPGSAAAASRISKSGGPPGARSPRRWATCSPARRSPTAWSGRRRGPG